jgi:phosphatidylserine/phosphatidylglycerophosphate/cardiolipin synthase-like enzyme
LHDTGTIVRGEDALQPILRIFALRWDDAMGDRGAHPHLDNLLERQARSFERREPNNVVRLRDLRRRLSRVRPLLFDRQVRRGANYNSTADQQHTVPDWQMAVTLPSGMTGSSAQGVDEIRRAYRRLIGTLTGIESFLFAESQFFEDTDIAKRTLEAYRAGGVNREGPFAFFLLPYRPETVWLDFFGLFSRDGIVTAEMRNLKWLEIRTAKVLYVQDGAGIWQFAFRVDDPLSRIRFLASNDDPTGIDEDSEFRIEDAVVLGNDGAPTTNPPTLVTRTLRAHNVLTDSDIAAYTLVATERSLPGGGRDRVPLDHPGPAAARLRAFMDTYAIYIHSKCSIFYKCEPAGRNWATVGSANLNPRSLGQLDPDETDSEMNMFWREDQRVREFLDALFAEHADLGGFDPVSWQRRSWRNLESIMRGGGNLQGSAVRLDVVDRKLHIV